MTSIREPDAARDDQEFQHSLIAAIREASPDGILVVDDHGVVVSHNQRFFDVLGIVPGMSPGDRALSERPLLSRALELVRDPDGFLQRVQALYADPLLEDHCEIEMKDGRTLERHSRALWGAHRQYLGRVWFFRDITARKQAEAALQQLTQRDPLTGVANRRHFFERATEEFARARRYGHSLSFIMLEITWP